MVHNDTELSVVLRQTAPDLSISDFKYRGGLNKILKVIVANNRHIDPITTRQEQQLIKITDKL
jgi:hypothetical protein